MSCTVAMYQPTTFHAPPTSLHPQYSGVALTPPALSAAHATAAPAGYASQRLSTVTSAEADHVTSSPHGDLEEKKQRLHEHLYRTNGGGGCGGGGSDVNYALKQSTLSPAGTSSSRSPAVDHSCSVEDQYDVKFVSSSCVLLTYYSGDVASVVNDHFSKALSVPQSDSASLPMSQRGLPASFWDSSSSSTCSSTSPTASGSCLPSHATTSSSAGGSGSYSRHHHYQHQHHQLYPSVAAAAAAAAVGGGGGSGAAGASSAGASCVDPYHAVSLAAGLSGQHGAGDWCYHPHSAYQSALASGYHQANYGHTVGAGVGTPAAGTSAAAATAAAAAAAAASRYNHHHHNQYPSLQLLQSAAAGRLGMQQTAPLDHSAYAPYMYSSGLEAPSVADQTAKEFYWLQ